MKFKKIYFVRIVLGEGQLYALSLGLRDIQHNMSMVLDTRFHIWFIMTVYYKMRQILLQNAIAILLHKCDRSLLQNAPGFLLQNATVLLQNAAVIAKCDDFITKCNSNYKIQRLLQTALVQCGLKIITFGPISETFYAVTYLELIRKVLRNNKQ